MLKFFNREKKATTSPPPLHGPGSGAQPVPLEMRQPGLSEVKNIVAIASGKGGVGKSTMTANLALALHQQGHRVGVLDADIYGPSQCNMFGVPLTERPKGQNNRILPLEVHGVKFISMGVLLGDEAPVIWRAPMATRAVSQFLNVLWGELDYLLIDLPPGTGDIQITLAQQASLTGAVVVSTPQQVAVGIAKKGLEMFRQVNVPILGLIENMSGFECENCHHVTPIFSTGGAEKVANDLAVPFLGRLPLDPQIMQATDEGTAHKFLASGQKSAQRFLQLASALEQKIEKLHAEELELTPTSAAITTEGHLYLAFEGGLEATLPAYDLRLQCPCAHCVDETTGEPKLNAASVPLDIKITLARPVGRYGLALDYSQSHNTGIFRYERLLELAKQRAEGGSFSV